MPPEMAPPTLDEVRRAWSSAAVPVTSVWEIAQAIPDDDERRRAMRWLTTEAHNVPRQSDTDRVMLAIAAGFDEDEDVGEVIASVLEERQRRQERMAEIRRSARPAFRPARARAVAPSRWTRTHRPRPRPRRQTHGRPAKAQAPPAKESDPPGEPAAPDALRDLQGRVERLIDDLAAFTIRDARWRESIR